MKAGDPRWDLHGEKLCWKCWAALSSPLRVSKVKATEMWPAGGEARRETASAVPEGKSAMRQKWPRRGI
jgi:hypothetical protein